MEKINITGLNEIIYKDVCDNGLEVYVWQSERVKTTYMTLSVKYGSIHTDFKINNHEYHVPNGTAHFLEHVKFNESKDFTAHDFFKKTGADTNAFTTFKYTSYLVFALDKIEENLNHLLDFVQNPFFSNKLIQKEKGIIIEEAKMGQDNPANLEFFGSNKSLFKTSKYRNVITGTPEDVKQISLEHVKTVFENFYTPDNMFLIVTGNVNPYEIFEIVKNNQKQKKFNIPKKREIITPNEPERVNEPHTVVEANISNPIGNYFLKIPRKKFKEYSDLEIRNYLNLILRMNFDGTSDFKEELMSNKLITGLSANASIMDDYVIINVGFDSKYPDEIIKRIKSKMSNLEINEAAFKRKIRARIASLIVDFEDVETVNSQIQNSLINYNEILYDIKHFLENIKYEDLININKKIKLNNEVEFIMVPKEKHE